MANLSPLGLLALVGFGTLEGAAFYYSGVLNPNAVVSQMRMQTMIMMKLFMSAIGSSCIAQAVLYLQNPAVLEATRKAKDVPFWRLLGGAFILGIGTTLCGAGPSLYPGALVALDGAYYTVFGALAGGFAFGILEKAGVFPALKDHKNPEQVFLDKKLGVNYSKMGFIAGTALIAMSWGVELLWPTSKDLAYLNTDFGKYTLYGTVAGLALGLNQYPLRLIGGIQNGASTSMASMSSALTGGYLNPSAKLSFSNLGSFAQISYIWVGTALGVLICTKVTSPELTEAQRKDAFPPLRQMLGGFLSILGGRISSGCLCGGGVSGVAGGNTQWFAGTAAIFAGGMLTAALI